MLRAGYSVVKGRIARYNRFMSTAYYPPFSYHIPHAVYGTVRELFPAESYAIVPWVVNACAKCGDYRRVISYFVEPTTGNNPDEIGTGSSHLLCPVHGWICGHEHTGETWIEWLSNIK